MSMKRGSASMGGRRTSDDGAKVDRQELFDDLRRRAETLEPFSPAEVAQAIDASESKTADVLHILAFERLLEKVEGGKYRAGEGIKQMSQADFNKAIATKIDPKRQQEQLEIDRLKRNNDEMRRRLLEAVAERDRYAALLKKHGIDPSEQV